MLLLSNIKGTFINYVSFTFYTLLLCLHTIENLFRLLCHFGNKLLAPALYVIYVRSRTTARQQTTECRSIIRWPAKHWLNVFQYLFAYNLIPFHKLCTKLSADVLAFIMNSCYTYNTQFKLSVYTTQTTHNITEQQEHSTFDDIAAA